MSMWGRDPMEMSAGLLIWKHEKRWLSRYVEPQLVEELSSVSSRLSTIEHEGISRVGGI